jgi:hypothetical protein
MFLLFEITSLRYRGVMKVFLLPFRKLGRQHQRSKVKRLWRGPHETCNLGLKAMDIDNGRTRKRTADK